MKARSKVLWLILGCVLVTYIGSYIFLSKQGRFEPEFISVIGVQQYGWAPKGFVQEYKWNHRLMIAYLPLYYLDRSFWHKSGLHTPDKKYPINEVADKDVWKVYIAWGIFHYTKKNSD